MGLASPQSNHRNAFSSGRMSTEHLKTVWATCKIRSTSVTPHNWDPSSHCKTFLYKAHNTLKFTGHPSPGSSSVLKIMPLTAHQTRPAPVLQCTIHLSSCSAVLSHHQGQHTTLKGQLHLPASAPPQTEHVGRCKFQMQIHGWVSSAMKQLGH